jgi:hypothetical protein
MNSVIVSNQYNIDGNLKWQHVLEKEGELFNAITYYFSEHEVEQYIDFFVGLSQEQIFVYKFVTVLDHSGMPVYIQPCSDDHSNKPIPVVNSLTTDKWDFAIRILNN